MYSPIPPASPPTNAKVKTPGSINAKVKVTPAQAGIRFHFKFSCGGSGTALDEDALTDANGIAGKTLSLPTGTKCKGDGVNVQLEIKDAQGGIVKADNQGGWFAVTNPSGGGGGTGGEQSQPVSVDISPAAGSEVIRNQRLYVRVVTNPSRAGIPFRFTWQCYSPKTSDVAGRVKQTASDGRIQDEAVIHQNIYNTCKNIYGVTITNEALGFSKTVTWKIAKLLKNGRECRSNDACQSGVCSLGPSPEGNKRYCRSGNTDCSFRGDQGQLLGRETIVFVNNKQIKVVCAKSDGTRRFIPR
jgi:hypothetical protein